MRLTTRLGTTLTASVLAVGGLTFVGAGVADATHGHCGYPPGQCQIRFDQSSYFPGHTVGFTTDRAFKKHEKVDGRVTCRHKKRFRIGPFKANSNHRVNSEFKLPKHLPKGTCTAHLVGEDSGWGATGSFRIKHHHH